MTKGTRVIIVANRKGGVGKSTLVRGLTSAAVARGEQVTVFDTDSSKAVVGWMEAGQQQGNWDERAEVIHTLDPSEIAARIEAIYAEPEHDHLVLIDTFGGASEALDMVVMQSHLLVAPTRPTRGDFTETMATLIWHERLKGRVSNPESVPDYRVIINGITPTPSVAEREAIHHIFDAMKAIEEPVLERKAYKQMDSEGLLGMILDKTPNPIVQKPLTAALEEMEAVLDLLDAAINEKEAQ